MIDEDIRERFEVRSERFEHGSFAVDLLLPISSEALIDVSDFNADERLPYWAEVWPSARALAREILEGTGVPARVLELGCGVGLPSLAAAGRGSEVLATDYYRDALLFTGANAFSNRLAGVVTREVDWRSIPPDLPRFPLVLAADVLYEARNVEPLAAALDRLTEPDGEAWVADPGRIHLPSFLDRMSRAGWAISAERDRVETAPAVPDRPVRVRITRLRAPDDATRRRGDRRS